MPLMVASLLRRLDDFSLARAGARRYPEHPWAAPEVGPCRPQGLHFPPRRPGGHAGCVTTTRPAAGTGSGAAAAAVAGPADAAGARHAPRRVPRGILVLGSVVSVQVGAAVAERLFPE